MKWLEVAHLEAWAKRIDARTRLSEIVSQLVRASASGISAFDFPTGDSAQRPGYDGRLTAIPAESFREFLPEGDSVWEFGTSEDYHQKANDDYEARTDTPGQAVDRASTTFVFVTPRKWVRNNPTLADWVATKKLEGRWQDVKVIDALALETWLEQCPAVAASVARDILGTLPETGALSTEEYWQEYSSQFEPHLQEGVLVVGRDEQVKAMLRDLNGGGQVNRWQGDSLTEVLAFMIACVRTSEESVRKFLESRILVLESKEAARRLAGSANLIFSVSGPATELAGRLANDHPVIYPLGRDSLKDAAATRLSRPSTYEISKALEKMGIDEAESHRLALECDRSVTILARRIPSATARRPNWHNDGVLVPALLAGAWDSASAADRAIVARLAGEADYGTYEAKIRGHRQLEDAPLESVDTVWAVRAPVDVFVNLASLLGEEHFAALEQVAQEVFGHINPALDLAVDQRPFARLRGATLPHSPWLREGLANTLLVVAAHGEKSGIVVNGSTPQRFINAIVAGIPALRENDRVMSSLSHQLPLLMEAAPDPLLFALEQLLEGDGHKLLPIFQDTKDQSTIFTSSPHTGFLWALEMIAWDPIYLSRAASILLKLAHIDPGGALSNRPLRSLRHIFLAWLPGTNASLPQRLAVLDELLDEYESTAWELLVNLLPKGHDVGDSGPKPRYREAGASERQIITYPLLDESYREIIHRAVAQAGVWAERWQQLLDTLHTFPDTEQRSTIDEFESRLEQLGDADKASLWQKLSELLRHHKTYSQADWSLKKDIVERLDGILEKLRPNDPIHEVLWLFEERFPTIEYKNADDFQAEVERLRRDAVLGILNEGGIDAVLNLADRAKAPRLIGLAAGYIVRDEAQAKELASASFSRGQKFDEFASLLSAAVLDRFGIGWSSAIQQWREKEGLTAQQIATLTRSWPHKRTTWEYVSSFGKDVDKIYWQSRQAWGIQADAADLTYAVERYLAADRAELIVTGLFGKVKDIPGPLMLETLDQFDKRIGAEPSILKYQNLSFDLQQFFDSLRARTDVTLEQIAIREYRYLPLLRATRVFSRESNSLALDKFMVESPEFFVKILCDVYSAASDRQSEMAEVSEDARARAHIGWTLLEGFVTVPGRSDDQIDIDVLKDWVAGVWKFAAEKDRFVIAEQKIGALLAHAPADPEDKLWPHKTIRQCLEDWKSDEIERGLLIERINMRGVTSRAPRDGGEQERVIAHELRLAAKNVNTWPRTENVLLGLADHWEEAAKREDVRARQNEMRE